MYPFYTTEQILSEAGITAQEAQADEEPEELITQARPQKSLKESIKDMSLEQLSKALEEALHNEEYERAAKIRDEIAKRN